jgi:hypothetical protein
MTYASVEVFFTAPKSLKSGEGKALIEKISEDSETRRVMRHLLNRHVRPNPARQGD